MKVIISVILVVMVTNVIVIVIILNRSAAKSVKVAYNAKLCDGGYIHIMWHL